MWIDPRLLGALKESGLTCEEAANLFREAFNLLPTAEEAANNLYANLKWWRENGR